MEKFIIECNAEINALEWVLSEMKSIDVPTITKINHRVTKMRYERDERIKVHAAS